MTTVISVVWNNRMGSDMDIAIGTSSGSKIVPPWSKRSRMALPQPWIDR